MEQAIDEGERAPKVGGMVDDAAAFVREITSQCAMGDRQLAIVKNAATITLAGAGVGTNGVRVGKRQSIQRYGRGIGDFEYASRAVAAHREVHRPRPCNCEVLPNHQFSAGQRDGAGDGEVNGVAGRGVGDGLAERAGATIVEVDDGEGVGSQGGQRAEEQDTEEAAAEDAEERKNGCSGCAICFHEGSLSIWTAGVTARLWFH